MPPPRPTRLVTPQGQPHAEGFNILSSTVNNTQQVRYIADTCGMFGLYASI
jgi:hypothetical protein